MLIIMPREDEGHGCSRPLGCPDRRTRLPPTGAHRRQHSPRRRLPLRCVEGQQRRSWSLLDASFNAAGGSSNVTGVDSVNTRYLPGGRRSPVAPTSTPRLLSESAPYRHGHAAVDPPSEGANPLVVRRFLLAGLEGIDPADGSRGITGVRPRLGLHA